MNFQKVFREQEISLSAKSPRPRSRFPGTLRTDPIPRASTPAVFPAIEPVDGHASSLPSRAAGRRFVAPRGVGKTLVFVVLGAHTGRWIHAASGRVYNTDFNAPKVPGRDDVTGEPLVQREDDAPESVRRRLRIYSEMAGPILEYYAERKVLARFSGRTTDEIWPQVYAYLAARIEPKEKNGGGGGARTS